MATDRETSNPYAYDARAIEEPPRALGPTLRRIGPGMLLTATIVGTGELIATTRLGAEVGYVMLWAIILSCVAKTIFQAVWGRYTIATGETGLAAMNHVPGPRAFGVNWVVWAYAAMIVLSISLISAMYAGVAQVMVTVAPGIALLGWVAILAAVTLAVLLRGSYRRVEGLAIWLVATFTVMTIFAAAVLTSRPEYFTWTQIVDGLQFGLPEKGIVIAVAVFGITGVNSGELFAYPYWCVEKGYARFTGPREASEDWRRRARGWIRVMHFDIFVSMLVYTLATVAFYFLGAGILHTLGQMPKGNEMITVLSRMYTETLGTFGLYLFYLGAIAVLYSTIFGATAANARIYADMMRLMGRFESDDHAARLRYQRAFVIALTALPCAVLALAGEPVAMVRWGGIVLALMLPVIGIAVVYLRHQRLPQELAPSAWVTAALWFMAALTLVAMTAYVLVQVGLVKR